MAVADLNEDGYIDIVLPNEAADYSSIYWGSATGYSDTKRTDLRSKGAKDIAVADLDKNGVLDIVISQEGYIGYSYIYYGQKIGDSIYYSESFMDSLEGGSYAVEIKDINKDGYLRTIA